jgi:hypothetical protein
MESISYFVKIGNPLPPKFCHFVKKGVPRVQAKQVEQAQCACEKNNSFLGSTMVPKSHKRQSFLTMLLYKTGPFTLNWRHTFMTIRAKVYDELQNG